MARDVFEQGLLQVDRVNHFTVVFAAYLCFEKEMAEEESK
jgi:hypothetical protein